VNSSLPYDLEIEDSAAEKIEAYLNPRFSEGPERDSAIETIEEELERLASNPVTLGKTDPRFPVPTFHFKRRIGGVERLFKVAFCYAANERTIVILDFKELNIF